MKAFIFVCILLAAAAVSSCASGHATLPLSSGPITVGMRGDNFLRKLAQGGPFSCEGRICGQAARYGAVPVSAEFTLDGDPSTPQKIFVNGITLWFPEQDYQGMLAALTDTYGPPVRSAKLGIERRKGARERKSASWTLPWGKISLQSFARMNGQMSLGQVVMTGQGVAAPQ